MLLKNVPFNTSVHADYSYQPQDPIANAIVSQYSWSTLVALRSTGNGDCLFNSFSICLSGDESRAIELRYRCCIEMVTNRTRMLRHRLYRALEPVSPDFDRDCLNCAQKGQYASMWNVLALANLLKVKVTVIYPAVNGSETYSFKNLNQKIKPPFVDPEKPTITIMWTSIRPPPRNGLSKQTGAGWEPNHFVPLVSTNRPVEKADPPETTDHFKDISNEATNPVTINGDQQKKSVALTKGTLPGVQHADVRHNGSIKVLNIIIFYQTSVRGVFGSHRVYNTLT